MKRKITLSILMIFVSLNVFPQTPCTSSGLPAALQSGLVAYFPFCGDADDESGNGNNGTVSAAVLATDRYGNANSSYYFNGNAYINFPVNGFPVATAPRTISVWFKFNLPATGIQSLFAYGDNISGQRIGLTYNGAGPNLHVEFVNSWSEFNWTADSLWHNLVAVIPSGADSTGDALLYFDCVQMTPTVVNPVALNTTACCGYLGYLYATFYPFNGYLDDVSVYDTAFSQTEVNLLCTSVGISENNVSGTNISVFPNPASDYFTISFGSSNKKAEVTITNITGEIIYTTTATDKIELSTKDFANGIFIVCIRSAELIEMRKLIIAK